MPQSLSHYATKNSLPRVSPERAKYGASDAHSGIAYDERYVWD